MEEDGIVGRATGVLTRSVRADIVVSVPGHDDVKVGGSASAVLQVLDEPGTVDDIIERITALGGRPDDGVDERALVHDAIAALEGAGIVTVSPRRQS